MVEQQVKIVLKLKFLNSSKFFKHFHRITCVSVYVRRVRRNAFSCYQTLKRYGLLQSQIGNLQIRKPSGKGNFTTVLTLIWVPF